MSYATIGVAPMGATASAPHLWAMRNELRSCAGLFWFVFESGVDAVVVLDARGDVVMANAAARALPGVALAHRFTLQGTSDDVVAALRAAIRSDRHASADLTLAVDGGNERHLAVIGALHDDYEVVMLRDVTDLRRADDELRHLRRVDSLGYLTASVVHDFNNLLLPIMCTSALLEQSPADPAHVAELVADIRGTAERGAALTRQLLAFIRGAGPTVGAVSVNDVVTGTVDLVRRVVGEGVTVQLALEPHLGATVVDREQLEHVLLNLAANARDAMPHGGTLSIATANVAGELAESDACPGDRDYVRLSLTDTGEGMTAAVREHLFERFFTTKDAGTGLGLATAHRFAEQSDGVIAVRSAPGEGTTVVLYLPRTQEERVADEPPTTREGLPRGTETVLVVEDDPHVRSGLATVLAELGYRVLEAADAAAATRHADNHPVDLVLVDVVLSGFGASGPALVDQLQRAGHTMRVLFMSGHTDKVIRDHGVRDGVDVLIRKAFSPSELSHTVRRVLDGKRGAQPSAA